MGFIGLLLLNFAIVVVKMKCLVSVPLFFVSSLGYGPHGLTTTEAPSNLYISNHNVIFYRKNLMSKMNIPNTTGMARRAFEFGILSFTLTSSPADY